MIDTNLLKTMSKGLPEAVKKAIGDYDKDIITRNKYGGVGEVEFLCYKRFCEDIARMSESDFPYIFLPEDMEYLLSLCDLLVLKQDKKTIPLKLRPFQAYIVASIICWREKADHDCTRFRSSYVSMARKNGKSFLQAILLLYNMAVSGLENSSMVIASVKEDTAMICFKYFLNLILSNDDFEELFTYQPTSGAAFCRLNGNELHVLTGNDKNDGLCISFAVLDEYNLMNRKTIKGIEDATVNSKYSSTVAITTAQYQLGGEHHIEYTNNMRRLRSETLPQDFLFLVWEPDKELLHDEREMFGIKAIRQANPMLMFGADGTRDQWHERMYVSKAKTAQGKDGSFEKQSFIIKQLNSWSCISDEEFNYEDLSAGDTSLTMKDLVELGYNEWYVGVDLGKTNDLTAIDFLTIVRVSDGKIMKADSIMGAKHLYHTCYNFMGASLLGDHEIKDKYAYSTLVNKELFLTTGLDGKRCNYEEVVDFIRMKMTELKITYKVIAADGYMVALIQDPLSEICEYFIVQPQAPKNLSSYTEQLLAMSKNHELHCSLANNKLFVNAIASSVISRDSNNYAYIQKRSGDAKSNLRIDSLDAFVTGSVAALIDMANDQGNADEAVDEWFSMMQ